MIASTETLRRLAYERLRAQLLDGGMPPGTRVSELKTARELGISRGPVREAVSQLASEGLIDQIPGLGAFVKVPDAREMADLYDFRDALESFAAGAAAGRVTPEHVTRLAECQSAADAILRRLDDRRQTDLDDASASEWSEIDARFHGTILSAAGNPLIQRHAADVRFLRRIWCRRLDAKVFDVRAVLAQSLRDHARIIAAIKRRDADAAHNAMSAHVQFTKRNYVQQMEQLGTDGRQWPLGGTVASARLRATRAKEGRSRR